MRIVFGIFICLILWTYLGYPLLLYLLSKLPRTASNPKIDSLPPITIIIAAYNEEDVIERRIKNCLELDYPEDKLQVIIGSDGSTDRTAEIARGVEDERVKVLDFPENRGRPQVHNDCAKEATGEILFFSDADTLFQKDCIKKMVRHYADPKVGCVGGELIFRTLPQRALGGGQRVYWLLEYGLRRWQSQLGVLAKVSGANMSIRKELYQDLPEIIDIDQAAGPLAILHGYRMLHEPEAIAYEELPTSLSGELVTRKRFTIQSLTALWHYKALLNPFRHPWLSFHLISYRLLRYLVPFGLLGTLISNGFLLQLDIFYRITFALQVLFYLLALGAFPLERRGKSFLLISWPFAFCFFNLGILLGGIQFLLGKRIRAYKPVD